MPVEYSVMKMDREFFSKPTRIKLVSVVDLILQCCDTLFFSMEFAKF